MIPARPWFAALASAAALLAQPGPIVQIDRKADPSWEYWVRKEFGGSAPAQVLRLDGELIVVTHGSLFRRDPKRGKWVAIGDSRTFDAAAAFGHDLLTSSRKLGLSRIGVQGRVLEIPANPLPSSSDFRDIVRDGSGRTWVANKRALLRIEGPSGDLRLRIEALPGAAHCQDPCGPPPTRRGDPWKPAQAVDVEIDEAGRPWVGYTGGLAWFDHGVWRRLRVDPELTDVRSFALAGDIIWIAGRKDKAFIQLRRRSDRWTAIRFTPADGYGPPDTFFIKRDSRGWIWRGTTDGVRVSDGTHLEPENWLRLNAENGLPCGEADNYGFFEDEDRSVWIAGDAGVTHLKPNPAWFDSSQGSPKVKAIEARARVIRIQLEGKDLSPFRQYPFRCRMAGEPWKTSHDGAFEFRALNDGCYTLEFGYTGKYAAVSKISVRVGPSALWTARPVWFFSLAAMTLLAWCILQLEYFEPLRYQSLKLWFIIRRRIIGSTAHPEFENAPTADLTGRTLLDRYEVGEPIAHGGFSTVYAALDRATGKKAAIKHLQAPHGDMRGCFTKEVAALRSTHHPGVVAVLDSWIDEDGEACLAMPFLEGPTLRHRLRQGPLDLAQAANVVRGVAAALGDMHARGIVHRDVKPENIILTTGAKGECFPVLIDFGIAGLRDRRDRLSVTRTMTGSFLYMAPECVTGHYSTATDVYSFAVLTLEIITLKKLLDIQAEFHDPEFIRELKDVIGSVMAPARSGALAEVLAQAYNPAPPRRPPVEDLAARVMALLTLSA